MKNEQVPISPAVTTATTAQSYNPFGADSSAHTNIPIAGANQPQQTPNNPFVTQMQPQGVVPQAARTEPVTFNAPQYAMVQPVANTSPVQEPGVSAQLTGYYSINNHLTPTFTGAGFGGYSVSQGTTSGFDQQVAQSQTGSNNPFALRNPATIATGNPTQEPILNNPFSEPNFNEQNAGLPPQQQVISNPFQNQTHLQQQQQQQKVLSSTINSVMTTPTSMQGSTNVQRFDNVQFPAPYTQNLPQQLQQQQGSYAPATAAVTPIVNTTGIVQPQTIPFYPQQQQQSQTQHQGLGDRYTNGNFNLIDM